MMPPVEQTKADPLTVLFDEIELLSAQTRSLELSLKRAHTDAFEQVEKFQQQFRAKLSSLKAEFENRESSGVGAQHDGRPPSSQNQDLLRRFAEQQNLLQRAREESERRGAAIVALREQVARLEATNRELQQASGAGIADAQAKIAALQSEIAHKTALLTQNQATIARLEEDLRAISQSSSKETVSLQPPPETALLTRRDAEIAELRAAARRQEKAAAEALAHARESLGAEIESLRSELKQKQTLLEQYQSGQKAEQELRNAYRELQGRFAAKESVIESQEYHLRTAQTQLLAAREALEEKERAFAELAARAAEEGRNFHDERNRWQLRLSESQVLAERQSRELAQVKAELATALGHLAQEQSAARQQAERLGGQVDELTRQLDEKQAILGSQSETLRRSEARAAELSATLAETQDALAKREAGARDREENLTRELAGLRLELQHSAEALRERDRLTNRSEPDLTAQIEDLQKRLQEKERLLDSRAHEVAALQGRLESLSGQTARLEAAQQQALASTPDVTGPTREALQAEIAALRAASDKQQVLLEERQAALAELENKLRAEIHAATEQKAEQRRLLEKQSADLHQATEEGNALRTRMADTQAAARDADEVATRRSESDAKRIAALERDLESTQQTLAERQAALARLEQQLHHERSAGVVGAHNQTVPDDLRAAQDKIAELLDRLTQLEAARQSLQENAGHELQQVRESFETRIAKLRMELAAKEQAGAQADSQIAIARLEEGYQKQIQELHSQLAEQHSLLENRNEELIRVKAALDDLHDRFTRSGSGSQQSADKPASVELREEDALDPPNQFNGWANPETVQVRGAEAIPGEADPVSNRFTQLEGRVRAWNPQPEKDSAFGAGRRWHIGLFKRRWKA